MIIVGNERVGKTSLVKCFLGEKRNQQPVENETIGADIHPWKFKLNDEEKLVKNSNSNIETEGLIHIWDFGGQSKYQCCQQFFFSPNSLFLLVFNLDHFWKDKSSCFSELEEWIFTISSRLPHHQPFDIVLVGTHLDIVLLNSKVNLKSLENQLMAQFKSLFMGKHNPIKHLFFVDTMKGTNVSNLSIFIQGNKLTIL